MHRLLEAHCLSGAPAAHEVLLVLQFAVLAVSAAEETSLHTLAAAGSSPVTLQPAVSSLHPDHHKSWSACVLAGLSYCAPKG